MNGLGFWFQFSVKGSQATRSEDPMPVRMVRYLAIKGGIRQFLDLGSGLPTQANVHELAQGVTPAARVVYVDNDPLVASHGRALRGLRARRAGAHLDHRMAARAGDRAHRAAAFHARRRRPQALADELVVDAAFGSGQRVAGAAPAELDQLGGDRYRGLLRRPGP